MQRAYAAHVQKADAITNEDHHTFGILINWSTWLTKMSTAQRMNSDLDLNVTGQISVWP